MRHVVVAVALAVGLCSGRIAHAHSRRAGA